jgi:GAF domain-containing protein
LSSILNVEDLLVEVVNQIQRNFGYYHAHIYLLDKERQNLVVAAGTGSAGVAMKAQGHHIPLHAPTSLVARSARVGEIVQVDDVRQTPDWLPNPLLPDTYSEMAVPILLEGSVVGVLDVQQNEIGGLDKGDAALLRSLANQVAVAINNARLFEEVQSALAEARAVQQRYVEQTWDKDMVTRRGAGRVQFSLGESKTLSEKILAQARQHALTHRKASVMIINEDGEVAEDRPAEEKHQAALVNRDGTQQILVAPVTLGDTIIGNLQLHIAGQNREWSDSDLALINAVIDQVAQTAENLRLFNETQERASRERLIGQMSDKLRRAPDMPSLMKIAVDELSRVLDPDRVFVQFDSAAALKLDENGDDKAAEKITETPPPLEEDNLVLQDLDTLVQYSDPESGNGSGR